MTTRVQKGSAVFKPVAQPRGRQTARQPSVSAGDRNSIAPSTDAPTAPLTTAPVPTNLQDTSQFHIPNNSASIAVIPTFIAYKPPQSTGSKLASTSNQKDMIHVIPSSGGTEHQSSKLPVPLFFTPPFIVNQEESRPPDWPNQNETSRIHSDSDETNNDQQRLLRNSGNVDTRSQSHCIVTAVASTSSNGTKSKRKASNIEEMEFGQTDTGDPSRRRYHRLTRNPARQNGSLLSSIRNHEGSRNLESGVFEDSNSSDEASQVSARESTDRTSIPEIKTSVRRSGSPTTTVTRKRSRRAFQRRLLDPVDGAGEDIDPTTVIMASLCEDTGQGRISTKAVIVQNNHVTWKASNREKRARMKVLLESRKYGAQDGSEDKVKAVKTPEPCVPSAQTNQEDAIDETIIGEANTVEAIDNSIVEDESGNGFDYSQSLAPSRFNVQVRIGPSGETIVDEESLFVDRNEEGETENYAHVEESDMTKFTNSSTYGKKYRGTRWGPEETTLFYDALSQFGENYELISYLLPGRDRKACKAKFKAEDKRNSARITECLNNRIPYDIATLSRMTGKDFSGPIPEIRAPVVHTLEDVAPPIKESTPASGKSVGKQRKKSRSMSRAPEDGLEVIGEVENFSIDD